MSRDRQRGESKIKSMFWLLVLFVLAFVLFRVAPAFMDNYWVQDAMNSEARFAAVTHKSEDDVREVIWKVVKDRDIHATPPIKREDIKVEYSGRTINIGMKYSILLDFYVYQYTLSFTPSAGDRPII